MTMAQVVSVIILLRVIWSFEWHYFILKFDMYMNSEFF